MSRRNLSTIASRIDPIGPDPAISLHDWLTAQADRHGLTWLLAHCEDGAIWGLHDGARLALSTEAFPQRSLALRWERLVQARLFSPDAELLLWPGPDGWQARLRRDSPGDSVAVLDERHLLWGEWSADPQRTSGPFMLLIEGRQGTRHAPPVAAAMSAGKRAVLGIRHYLHDDPTGLTQVNDSRLMQLSTEYCVLRTARPAVRAAPSGWPRSVTVALCDCPPCCKGSPEWLAPETEG